MSQRFFFYPDSANDVHPGQSITLDTQESHHLIHVMRAKVGDSISLFDGSGREYESQIKELRRSEVVVEIISATHVCRELEQELIVIVPLPKADRQKFLVEKLTEIGVTCLTFVTTSRSSVKGNRNSVAKLERTVIEASKQSGRNLLMQIRGPIDLQSLLREPELAGVRNDHKKYFAHPTSERLAVESAGITNGCAILIGPEGGLNDDEVTQLTANQWTGIGLGKSILRMETAALVSAALLSHLQSR